MAPSGTKPDGRRCPDPSAEETPPDLHNCHRPAHWYRNLEKNRAITIHAGSAKRDLRARLRKNKPSVRQVIRQFRDKYTAEQIKRWQAGLDAAVQIPLAATHQTKKDQ